MTGKLSVVIAAPLALCLAQSASAPAFDAASIKLNKSGSDRSRWDTHVGSMVAENKTLQSLVAMAYGVTDDRVTGGPNWVASDYFDIQARAASPARGDELRTMLQTLLAERFHLAVHREKATVPGYWLTQVKGGIKLRPDESQGKSTSSTGRGKMAAAGVSMAQLSQTLRRLLGDPVKDETGAPGTYSFTLEWNADASDGPPGSLADTLSDALTQTLGVKLENKKLVVDSIVIDKAERPSEN